ncbi:MAG: PHP domain-containing protein, partial [Candidatus Uhrbacteria bacterium]
LEVEGMGPKRTRFVWKAFGVRSVRDLKRLVRSGALAEVPGWGSRSVENLALAIAMHERMGERMPIGLALPLAERIAEALRSSGLCAKVEIAGSLRRRRETIGDLDFLVTSRQPMKVMEFFCALPEVQRVIARGRTKANVLLRSGIEADLRVLQPELFGAGLHYFTGSKAHNVHTRKMAIAHGLTISEYGVYRGTKTKKGRLIACRTERDVFNAIGLPYIPPELREDSGEVEAAQHNTLPKLIETKHLHGDLHLHSDYSDGTLTMEEVIAEARRAGLQYIALTDHASTMGMVRGMKTARSGKRGMVASYVKRVRAAAGKVRGIHVLAGAEVDILADGSLYLSDTELALLDWVVASVHSSFKQESAVATKRIIRAMEHPAVRVIGHPSGRLLGQRDGMILDWEAIMDAAVRTGTALELTASWHRLDLDDVHCRMARDHGARICINSDAHDLGEFEFRYGVAQARRGWIEPKDVVNAATWVQFQRRHMAKRGV